jgi:hypothetical protein
MTTIRSTLASGIHQVTPKEIAELEKPGRSPLPQIEHEGRQYHRTLFPFRAEKTIPVLRPNDAQKTELKGAPALFTELLQHAVDVNKSYFVAEPRPPSGTIEHRRHASRVDAFNREARELAQALYFPGPNYKSALDAIDSVGIGLVEAVHGQISWSNHPTLTDRTKLAIGSENFSGYDEQVFMPRGGGFGGSAVIRIDRNRPGDHVPLEELLSIAGRSIDWAASAGQGKKGA